MFGLFGGEPFPPAPIYSGASAYGAYASPAGSYYTAGGMAAKGYPVQPSAPPIRPMNPQAIAAEQHLVRAHQCLTQAEMALQRSMGWNNMNQVNTMFGAFERPGGLFFGGDNMLGAVDVMGEKQGVHEAQRLGAMAAQEVNAAFRIWPQMPPIQGAVVQDNNTLTLLFFDNLFTNSSERRMLEQSMVNLQRMQMDVDRNIQMLRANGGF